MPAAGRKSAGRKSVTKTPAKRKSTSRASTASSAKKGKKPVESEPDEEEDSDEDHDDSNDDDNEDDDDGEEESSEITRRNRRQVSGKNHPDKGMYIVQCTFVRIRLLNIFQVKRNIQIGCVCFIFFSRRIHGTVFVQKRFDEGVSYGW